MSNEEAEQHQNDEDLAEDLELEEESADKIRGGGKAKTADKAYTQMENYIKG
jgi:hypothetical protein